MNKTQRALEVYNTYKITNPYNNSWVVKKADKQYFVEKKNKYSCTCPDYYWKSKSAGDDYKCKHIAAVIFYKVL